MQARAVGLIENGTGPAEARRAIGAARKCLREPATLLPALQELRTVFDRAYAASIEASKPELENQRSGTLDTI